MNEEIDIKSPEEELSALDWEDKTKLWGKFLGYPECCTEQFINNNEEDKENRTKAASNSGFMPCSNCADLVLNNGIALESLLLNRAAPWPLLPVWPSFATFTEKDGVEIIIQDEESARRTRLAQHWCGMQIIHKKLGIQD